MGEAVVGGRVRGGMRRRSDAAALHGGGRAVARTMRLCSPLAIWAPCSRMFTGEKASAIMAHCERGCATRR